MCVVIDKVEMVTDNYSRERTHLAILIAGRLAALATLLLCMAFLYKTPPHPHPDPLTNLAINFFVISFTAAQCVGVFEFIKSVLKPRIRHREEEPSILRQRTRMIFQLSLCIVLAQAPCCLTWTCNRQHIPWAHIASLMLWIMIMTSLNIVWKEWRGSEMKKKAFSSLLTSLCDIRDYMRGRTTAVIEEPQDPAL